MHHSLSLVCTCVRGVGKVFNCSNITTYARTCPPKYWSRISYSLGRKGSIVKKSLWSSRIPLRSSSSPWLRTFILPYLVEFDMNEWLCDSRIDSNVPSATRGNFDHARKPWSFDFRMTQIIMERDIKKRKCLVTYSAFDLVQSSVQYRSVGGLNQGPNRFHRFHAREM